MHRLLLEHNLLEERGGCAGNGAPEINEIPEKGVLVLLKPFK
jgi:hypothetical protein